MATEPRPREVRDAAFAREELAHEYHELTQMNPKDPAIASLVVELRVKLAAKIAAGE
jgi:hypothetical protein